MDEDEAGALLGQAKMKVDRPALDRLSPNKGWPAGSTWLDRPARVSGSHRLRRAVRGDDRVVADYLHNEALTRPDHRHDFIVRSSVLDRLSARV